MGVTYIDGTATGPTGERAVVHFLVDSGAQYSLLPNDVWQRLGLKAKRVERFALADGTAVQRQVSECHLELPQGEGHTPVILGEPGDAALLGIITLEEMGLVLNPFSRELQPMRLLLV